MSDLPPARLSVLTASANAQAVIFRRGPSYATLSIGWDRDRQSFELGQWLFARIYPDHSDLSPDGRHLVCYAGCGRRGWWTAISHAPWLTARFVQTRDIGGVSDGGAFTADGRLALVSPSSGPRLI